MALIQVTAPAIEPLTADELRSHLRIPTSTQGGSTAEDFLMNVYIKVARKQAENYMKRQINHASWQLIRDDFPGSSGSIEIPRPPLSTVSTNLTITYINSTGWTSTVAATAYTVDYNSTPPRAFPSYGNSWPTDVREQPNAVTVNYVSGYSSSTSAIPAEIVTWVMMRAGVLYENREAITGKSFYELPHDHYMGLLDPYRIITFDK